MEMCDLYLCPRLVAYLPLIATFLAQVCRVGMCDSYWCPDELIAYLPLIAAGATTFGLIQK